MFKRMLLIVCMLSLVVPTLAQSDEDREDEHLAIELVTNQPVTLSILAEYDDYEVYAWFNDETSLWEVELITIDDNGEEVFLGWAAVDVLNLAIVDWYVPGMTNEGEDEVDPVQSQAAIDIVLADPEFVAQLTQFPDHTIEAYPAGGAFWEVEFFANTGDDDDMWIGWAMVDLETDMIQERFVPRFLTDAEIDEQTPLVIEESLSDLEVMALITDPDDWDIYTEYDAYEMIWGVAFERGIDLWIVFLQTEVEDDGYIEYSVMDIVDGNALSAHEAENSIRDEAALLAYEYAEADDILATSDDWQVLVQPVTDAQYTVEFVTATDRLLCLLVDVEADIIVEDCS